LNQPAQDFRTGGAGQGGQFAQRMVNVKSLARQDDLDEERSLPKGR